MVETGVKCGWFSAGAATTLFPGPAHMMRLRADTSAWPVIGPCEARFRLASDEDAPCSIIDWASVDYLPFEVRALRAGILATLAEGWLFRGECASSGADGFGAVERNRSSCRNAPVVPLDPLPGAVPAQPRSFARTDDAARFLLRACLPRPRRLCTHDAHRLAAVPRRYYIQDAAAPPPPRTILAARPAQPDATAVRPPHAGRRADAAVLAQRVHGARSRPRAARGGRDVHAHTR